MKKDKNPHRVKRQGEARRETIHDDLRKFIVRQAEALFDADAVNEAIDHWNEDRPPRHPIEFAVYDACETILADMAAGK